jgi:hypothetical protein
MHNTQLSLPGLSGQSIPQNVLAFAGRWIARTSRAMTIVGVMIGSLAAAHAQSPDKPKHCEELGGPPDIRDVPEPTLSAGLTPSEDAVLFTFTVGSDGSAINIRVKNALSVKRVTLSNERHVVEFKGAYYQILPATQFIDYSTEILRRKRFRGGSDKPCEWDFRQFSMQTDVHYDYPFELVDKILSGDADFPK